MVTQRPEIPQVIEVPLGPTEREKMLAAKPYLASDPELVGLRDRSRDLCSRFNATASGQHAWSGRLCSANLLGQVGEDVRIEPPFFCDYGKHLTLGDGVYLNVNCVILDCNQVTIGPAAKFGPGVHIYTALHPIDPAERRSGLEMARPVTIGANVWIGGGAILCPGVEIGDDSVIGAGSVVTRYIPAGVIAVGNPCRVVRSISHREPLNDSEP